MKRILFLLIGLTISLSIQASGNTRAKIVYVGTWGHGNMFIRLDTLVHEPDCPNKEIWISSSHPSFKEIFSIALAAYSTDQYVQVVTNGCVDGHPTFDETNNSFIHIGPR